jgi:hypothetical protein
MECAFSIKKNYLLKEGIDDAGSVLKFIVINFFFFFFFIFFYHYLILM